MFHIEHVHSNRYRNAKGTFYKESIVGNENICQEQMFKVYPMENLPRGVVQ